MMTKEEILMSGIIDEYVLGLTTHEESMIVLEYFKEYPELREHAVGVENLMEKIALENEIVPPTQLKSRIFKEFKNTPVEGLTAHPTVSGSRNSIGKYLPLGLGALLLLTLVGLGIALSNAENLKREVATTRSEFVVLQSECEKSSKQAEVAAMIANPNTTLVVIEGAQVKLEAWWNPIDKQGYMMKRTLPAVSGNQCHQLWGDINGEMINLGIIPNDGEVFHSIPFLPNVESLNITIEPAGGSEHPTVANLIASGVVVT